MRTRSFPRPVGSSRYALELRSIAHRFGPQWVLRSCNLSVEPGEAVALIGANGSGKTTLLRIAATLLRARRGEGSVCGHDLRAEPAAARSHLGFFAYTPALYEDLSAEENLRFAVQMRGRRPDDLALRRALDEVSLAADAAARVRVFSAGMRRRLALAHVFLDPPRLLLLDEPYAGLDTEGAQLVNRLVLRLLAGGSAVLLATHDLRRAEGTLDRVLLLEEGTLVPAPEDERPATSRGHLHALAGGDGECA